MKPKEYIEYRASVLMDNGEPSQLHARLIATIELVDRFFGNNWELLRHEHPAVLLQRSWDSANLCCEPTHVDRTSYKCTLPKGHGGEVHSCPVANTNRLEWPK